MENTPRNIKEISKLPKHLLAILVELSQDIDNLYRLYIKHMEDEHGRK